MNVVIMGKGELAIKAGYYFKNRGDSLTVVPVLPEPKWCSSLSEWASDHNIEVVDHYNDLYDKYDLIISIFYDKILSKAFLDKHHMVINLHNSPLPVYRGVRPINWALYNQEHKHGVTIHKVTPGIDDGPIYGQIIYPIYPEIEEVVDVYNKALKYGWQLFEDVIPKLHKIVPYVQDHNLATYYSAKQDHLLGNRSGFTRKESL